MLTTGIQAYTQAATLSVAALVMIVAGVGKHRLHWHPRDKVERPKWGRGRDRLRRWK